MVSFKTGESCAAGKRQEVNRKAAGSQQESGRKSAGKPCIFLYFPVLAANSCKLEKCNVLLGVYRPDYTPERRAGCVK